MQRPKPIVIAAIAAAAVLLIIAIVLLARSGGGNEDRLSDKENVAASAEEPEQRCASQRTYDAIKGELFRQAARVRGSDHAAFDRIANYSAIRVERPVLRSEDEQLGSVGCSGLVTLDLPPGIAVVGGRRSLSAEVGYIIQRAADASGDVVMLEGADPIIVPLATLARTAAPAPAPAPQVENATEPLNEIAPVPPVRSESEPAPSASRPGPVQTGTPSFDCGSARTRSEIAVCSNPALAALDRQMASQFTRAMAAATPDQRELLQSTRSRFLRFREGCQSDDCIADTYRGRMREISDIMAGRWRRPR